MRGFKMLQEISPARVRIAIKSTIEEHLTSSDSERKMNDIVVRNLLKKQSVLVHTGEQGDFLVAAFTFIFSFICFVFTGDTLLMGAVNVVVVVLSVFFIWRALKRHFCIFNLAKVAKSGDDAFALLKILLNNSASEEMDRYERERFMKDFLKYGCEKKQSRKNRKAIAFGFNLSYALNRKYKKLAEREAYDEAELKLKNLLNQFQGLSEGEGVVKANLLYQSLKSMNK